MIVIAFYKKTVLSPMKFFIETKIFKNHNFIKYYQVGGAQSANKPLIILKKHGFVIYSINFEQHINSYDFFNSEKIMDEFLNVVDKNFNRHSL